MGHHNLPQGITNGNIVTRASFLVSCILVCVLTASSSGWGAIIGTPTSKDPAYLIAGKFRKVAGAAEYDFLEAFIPSFLTASFFASGYPAGPPLADISQDLSASLERMARDLESIKRRITDPEASLTYVLTGSYFETKGKIRIDASIRASLDNSLVFAGSETIERGDLLEGLKGFAARMIAAYVRSLEPAATIRKKVLVVKCFDAVSDVSEDGKERARLLSDVLPRLVNAGLSSLGSLQQFEFKEWGKTEPICRDDDNTLVSQLGAEAIVSGYFELDSASKIAINLTIRIPELDESLGPFLAFEGDAASPEALLGIRDELIAMLRDVLHDIITNDGKWAISKLVGDSDFGTLMSRARSLVEENRIGLALLLLKKAYLHEPSNVAVHIALGEIYLKRRAPRKAIEEFRLAREIERDNVQALLGLGLAYTDAQQYEKAISTYKQADNLYKQSPNPDERKLALKARLKKGDVLYYQGNYKAAIETYNAVLEEDPSNAETYYSMGLIYASQLESGRAIEAFERASKLRPDDIRVKNALAKSLYLDADNLIKADKNRNAISQIRKAIELNPSDGQAHQRLGWTLSKVGYAENNNDLLRDAEQGFKRAIELEPTLALAHAGLGRLYVDRGKQEIKNYDLAIYHLGEAIRLEPKNAFAHLHLGRAYRGKRLYDFALLELQQAWELSFRTDTEEGYRQAREAIEQAIELKPNSPNLLVRLGLVILLLAERSQDSTLHELAVNTTKEAIRLDPKYALAYSVLGAALLDQKNIPEATKALEKAAELNPKDSKTFLMLANIYHEEYFDYDKALQNMRRAIELLPNNLDYQVSFVEVSLTSGNLDDVINLADKLQSDPALDATVRPVLFLLSTSSLVLKGHDREASAAAKKFLDSYRALPDGFKSAWRFDGTKKFLREKASGKGKDLLMAMLSLLEAAKSQDAIRGFEAKVRLFPSL